jgi:HD-GYP domain-containing protein (c-di-GMP phosphodiesterase class II)
VSVKATPALSIIRSGQPMTDTALVSERARTYYLERARRMELRELRAELVVGGAFLAAAALLALVGDTSGGAPLPVILLYVTCVAAASRVSFDVGAGFTVPTQVVFLPLLFIAPIALVPVLVLGALAAARVPGILARRVPVSRVLSIPANCWFAIGPAGVLALAGGEPRPDGAPALLAAALLAQLLCDYAASAVRERLRRGLTLAELVDESRDVWIIDIALTPLGVLLALTAVRHWWAVLLVAPLFALLRFFSDERRARLEQLIELNDAYRGTALVLGDIVEADDSYTGAHTQGVMRLALDVALELGLDAGRRRTVEFGALLHDVGKIAVPKEIINKPGALDEREWAIIRTHTIEGQRLLDRVGGIMREVGQVVRASHERWDGRGYPDALRGEEIPLEARIVSTCDAFNAMTTNRSYRPAMPVDDAVAELQRCAGAQFDPGVVDALLRAIGHDGVTAPRHAAAA